MFINLHQSITVMSMRMSSQITRRRPSIACRVSYSHARSHGRLPSAGNPQPAFSTPHIFFTGSYENSISKYSESAQI